MNLNGQGARRSSTLHDSNCTLASSSQRKNSSVPTLHEFAFERPSPRITQAHGIGRSSDFSLVDQAAAWKLCRLFAGFTLLLFLNLVSMFVGLTTAQGRCKTQNARIRVGKGIQRILLGVIQPHRVKKMAMIGLVVFLQIMHAVCSTPAQILCNDQHGLHFTDVDSHLQIDQHHEYPCRSHRQEEWAPGSSKTILPGGNNHRPPTRPSLSV